VACSWVGNRTISLPFDTQQITTMDIVFGNLGRILLTFVITRCRKSVTGRLLPRLPCFLTFRISLPHFFRHISTHCRRIQSELWKLFKGNQVSHVSKQSATPVSQCRGLCLSCFNRFSPSIVDRCFFSSNPAIHHFFHLLNVLSLACPILLAN
jgi:hypothetical protein